MKKPFITLRNPRIIIESPSGTRIIFNQRSEDPLQLEIHGYNLRGLINSFEDFEIAKPQIIKETEPQMTLSISMCNRTKGEITEYLLNKLTAYEQE